MILIYWLKAIRPKTLPLSISGILIGLGLAYRKLNHSEIEVDFWIVFLFSILTTLLFQITSNLSNDYSDFVKGTDNNKRIGPERMVLSGKISSKSMKMASIIASVLAFISALLLIYLVRNLLTEKSQLIYLFLACLSIFAAVAYTVGKNAYGYKGLGDLMVFLFFGLLSVIGSYLLFGLEPELDVLFFAFSIGLWSTSVLNLNNIRDYENDKNFNKVTVVVKLGLKKAIYYHISLVLGGYIFWMAGLSVLYKSSGYLPIFLSTIPTIVLFFHLQRVIQLDSKNLKTLNPELGKVALVVFLTSLTLFLVLIKFKF